MDLASMEDDDDEMGLASMEDDDESRSILNVRMVQSKSEVVKPSRLILASMKDDDCKMGLGGVCFVSLQVFCFPFLF